MKRIAMVGAVVLVLLSSAVALAAIPSADGTIHGCRETKTGVLRVIDAEAGQTCTTKETALTWNQTGPAGPAGPPGPQGDPGPAGVSGYEVVSNTITAETIGVPVIAMCPTGKKLLGGGGGSGEADSGNNDNPSVVIMESRPMFPPDVNGWYVRFSAINGFTGSFRATAFAICANVT